MPFIKPLQISQNSSTKMARNLRVARKFTGLPQKKLDIRVARKSTNSPPPDYNGRMIGYSKLVLLWVEIDYGNIWYQENLKLVYAHHILNSYCLSHQEGSKSYFPTG